MKPTETSDPPIEDEELMEIERFERFSAYVDDEMDPQARAAFEADLEADAELRGAFEDFQQTLGALGSLDLALPARLPDAFVESVEKKIRVRSRGRFFNDDYHERVPYEIFLALMMAIMVALLLFGESKTKKDPGVDLAMSGDKAASSTNNATNADGEKKRPAGTTNGGATNGDAPKRPTPEVVPVRREVILYTLLITDAAPQARAETLRRQIEGMGSKFTVELKQASTPDVATLEVEMPIKDVESFLEAYGTEGKLRKARLYVKASEAPTTSRVTLEISKAP